MMTDPSRPDPVEAFTADSPHPENVRQEATEPDRTLSEDQLDAIENLAQHLTTRPGYPGWLTQPEKLLALVAEVRRLRAENMGAWASACAEREVARAERDAARAELDEAYAAIRDLLDVGDGMQYIRRADGGEFPTSQVHQRARAVLPEYRKENQDG